MVTAVSSQRSPRRFCHEGLNCDIVFSSETLGSSSKSRPRSGWGRRKERPRAVWSKAQLKMDITGIPPSLFPPQLWVATALNALIAGVQVGAYAARYAGALTKQIATSISLFNLIVTASRLANLLYAPTFSSLQDHARNIITSPRASPVLKYEVVDHFSTQCRIVLAGGSVGVCLGIVALPLFVVLFKRGTLTPRRASGRSDGWR